MNAMLSEESVWDLKGFMRQVENTGLDVEYRCVRCRSCADCRNADESDKILDDILDSAINESYNTNDTTQPI